MMFFVVICGSIFSASVLYFIEHGAVDASGAASHFTSVHTSMWFVFISIATVGYGEIVPTTPAGKFVSAVICILGVLILAIPVSVVSQNFLSEFEAVDRRTVRMQMRIGNRSGRQSIGARSTTDAALEGRPATFHNAAAMTARQLQIAELRYDELLTANIERILRRAGTWGAELDGLLHDDRERTAKRLRQILMRQFNGRIWDNISA